MKKTLLLLVIGVVAAYQPACAPEKPKAQRDERIILQVADLKLTVADLDWIFASAPFASPEDEYRQKKEFLEGELNRFLLADAAYKQGLTTSAVDSAKESEIRLNVIFKREVIDRYPPHRRLEDIRGFWQKYGGVLKLQQIVVSSRRTADSLYAILRQSPERLAELAVAISLDTASAANGGQLDTLRVGRLPVPVEEVAFRLRPGQISAPVESPKGWHIVRLIERTQHDGTDFESQRGLYSRLYLDYLKRRYTQEFKQRLAEKQHFKYDDQVRQKLAARWNKIVAGARQAGFDPPPYLSVADLSEIEAKDTIASIDTRVMTAADLVRHFDTYHSMRGVNLDSPWQVRDLVLEKLFSLMMLAHGDQIGITKDPDYVSQLQRARHDLAYAAMVQKLTDTVRVSDSEVAAFYDQNKAQFVDPDGNRVKTLPEVKMRIRQQLLKQKMREILNPWLESRKNLVQNHIDLELLKTVLKTGKLDEK